MKNLLCIFFFKSLTGPVNLQEAKSLQPPFTSSVHLDDKKTSNVT